MHTNSEIRMAKKFRADIDLAQRTVNSILTKFIKLHRDIFKHISLPTYQLLNSDLVKFICSRPC